MLEARSVSYHVAGIPLVDAVSFTATRGKVVAIVGPTGAGKSTLLRLLSGKLPPSTGEVLVDARPQSATNRAALLPQLVSLSTPLAVADVVLLGRTGGTVGEHRPCDLVIARVAMAATGTLELEDRIFTTLSGGERQRVHAAWALAQIWDVDGPRVLLMDEPTVSLDLASQHVVLGAARRLASDGGTIVTVLHDLNLASQYADRVVVLAEGRVVAIGSPAEVLSQELIERVFEVDARIVPHPSLFFPLVAATGRRRSIGTLPLQRSVLQRSVLQRSVLQRSVPL